MRARTLIAGTVIGAAGVLTASLYPITNLPGAHKAREIVNNVAHTPSRIFGDSGSQLAPKKVTKVILNKLA